MVEDALCAKQPLMNDPPFIPTTGREVQQRRSGVLKLNEELQRVFPGGSAHLNRMRLNPAVPFLNNQFSCVSLLHWRVFPATENRGG